jgi:Histidine kinase-, DNA gyrase B-, and HSP90-like ATPase
MARDHFLPPSASSLSSSMRDLGYSLETAVADLVDNSISADATSVEIFCDLSGDSPTLAIVDDGRGMTDEELITAMRHGAVNPKRKRSATDLGRFGLGLKTASFSQCRRLTVLSRKNKKLSAAEWNLDLIDEKDDWILSVLDPEEMTELPFVDSLSRAGTVVIWRTLDRLFEDESGEKRQEIVSEKLDVLEKHLSLVFHRFIAGEFKGRKVKLSVNGHIVEAFDPFCRKNTATQALPEEIVHIGNASVTMQPFILPHHSRLTAKEYDFYQSRSDFISNQGAYVYRGGRLMAWGDWFRLIPKGEVTKLARIQIDFPNILDESWTIDIKKSRARPPLQVRERLSQIIERVSNRSITVHRGRGQKLFDEVKAPIWERFADNGKVRFAINLRHPLIEGLTSKIAEVAVEELNLLLESISSSLPVEMIYSDFSVGPRQVQQLTFDETKVLERLQLLKVTLFNDSKGDAATFREVMRSTKLFDEHSAIIKEFIRKQFNE